MRSIDVSVLTISYLSNLDTSPVAEITYKRDFHFFVLTCKLHLRSFLKLESSNKIQKKKAGVEFATANANEQSKRHKNRGTSGEFS